MPAPNKVAIPLVLVAALAMAEFFNPANTVTWAMGEQYTIEYRTDLVSYNIALWQEFPDGDTPLRGPVVFDTAETTDDLESRFEWVVQTYPLDLEVSNVFFFWLVEGNDVENGNQSDPNSFSSSYFNIIDLSSTPEPPPTPPPTTSTPSPTVSTKSTASTRSTSRTTASATAVATPSQAQDGGLSARTKAGLGVGVGVAGLITVSCLLLFWRGRAKKEGEVKAMQPQYALTGQSELPG